MLLPLERETERYLSSVWAEDWNREIFWTQHVDVSAGRDRYRLGVEGKLGTVLIGVKVVCHDYEGDYGMEKACRVTRGKNFSLLIRTLHPQANRPRYLD